MSSNKEIPAERWLEYFDQLTNGNRGRAIALHILDPDQGDLTPVQSMPLWAFVYDPVGKGNDLIIELGRDSVSYAHTIQQPEQVWQEQDDSGKVVALEITAEDQTKTIVQLH